MKTDNFDIIVIGAGSEGLSVGLTMNSLGFKVLMIARSETEIGGECLNTGCVPSKALIHVAGIVHQARRAAAFGWETSGRTDLGSVMDYVRAAKATIRGHENSTALRQAGITVILGHARFVGRRSVAVEGHSVAVEERSVAVRERSVAVGGHSVAVEGLSVAVGGRSVAAEERSVAVEGTTYSARKIVIATGSRPQPLAVPGMEMVKALDNESLFGLQTLPESLLVVGGGPVGIETAQAMARLGCRVTVVHNGDAILEHDDRAVTQILERRLRAEGINLLLNCQVQCFASANEARVSTASGDVETVRFDAVFVAAGRLLNIETLDLEAASVRVVDGKIATNAYLQTTNKHIFVCGDVAGGPKFSHLAEYHARILINNLLSPFRARFRYDHFSWVTFTDPEIATFGFTERQLRGRSYERIEQDFADDDRAVTDDYRDGKLVLFLKKGGLWGRRRILGGTMIAPHAGELIQEFLLLQVLRSSPDVLFDKIYPYPTAARVNQAPVVRYKQRQLTPGVKRLLQWLFKLK